MKTSQSHFLWLVPFALVALASQCNSDPADDTLNRAPITRQMRAFGKGTQSYNLACYYYVPGDPSHGQNSFLSRTPWVWGRDKNLESVVLKGHFEDGFLNVDNATYAESKENCENEIKRLFPGRRFELYRLTAKKTREYFYDYSLIFADEEQIATLPRVVLFGDSLSDNGNLKAWIGAFPAPPYFLGHFTNGPNWADYLSKEANLTVQNWAYGGAQSEPHNDSSRTEILDYIATGGRNVVTGSMSRYIRHYVNDYLLDGKIVAPEKTLFIIWIGGNDYLSKSDTSGAINRLIDDPEHPGGARIVAERTVMSIVDHIDFLYRVGARNFLVINLPDLGVSPMVAVDVNYHKADQKMSQDEKRYMLSSRLSETVKYHNDFLTAKLDAQRVTHPDARILLLDANGAMKKLLAGQHPDNDSPYDYGFELQTLKSALRAPNKPDIVVGQPCYMGRYTGSSNSADTCTLIQKALFFDQVHPTTQGHCWISYFVHRALADAQIIRKQPDLKEYEGKCKAL